MVFYFGKLGACFEAAAAGHAGAQLVACVLVLVVFRRAGAQGVEPIDGDPGFDAFEVVEHALPVDPEVSDDGELAHGGKGHGIAGVGAVVVEEEGAALASDAVDEHGARAADFFEAAGIPDDGVGVFSLGGAWVCGDPLEAGDDVGALSPLDGDIECFDSGGFTGAIASVDAEADGAFFADASWG